MEKNCHLKKVLVTGGKGFIGRQTLAPLLERGYQVHVVSSTFKFNDIENVTYHFGNLLNSDDQLRLLNEIKPSHLLHLAWYTTNGKFWDSLENVAWLKSSLSLAEAFYQQGGVRLVGVGTCAEYEWSNRLCRENSTPEIPSSLYGKLKKTVYECCSALAQAHNASFAWARIFSPYGEGEDKNRLIPYVITQLIQNKKAHCTYGEQVRDFLHVKDIGRALSALLDSPVEGAVNVASGIPLSIKNVVTQIAILLDREDLLKLGAIENPTYSPDYIVADIERLKNELQWVPTLTLHDGLLQTIAWWRGLN